jgi:cation diffusion facilitator family transporter
MTNASGHEEHGHDHDHDGPDRDGPDHDGHVEHGHDEHEHGHDEHDHAVGGRPHGGRPHGGHDHGHEHPSGIRGAIRSVFAPHSHDAADSVDQALTSSAEGLRALKISLAALAVTALLQVVVVLMSGSVALLGDTIHNFADALTAIPLGIAFVMGRRAANRRYTYGYGRAEDLAGIFIVLMIAASAALAAYEAIDRLLHPRDVRHVGLVIAAGIIGFIGNELVAVYRIRVGRKIGSAALVADGLHARTDGLTSLAVVVGAVLVAAGWQQADPIVGLVITVAILSILRSAARDIYRRLMDSVEPELVDQVERVLAGVDGIETVDSVRIRWIGHELRAEAEIVSDADLTFPAAHAIAEEARHRLLHEVPRLADALIHTSPCAHDGDDGHAATAHHFP